MSRDLFLNIGLLVGAVSCVTIPCFAWLADRYGLRRIYLIGALIGLASAVPFFVALEARSIAWIVIFSILLANAAHDMVVSVQQPLFTELFGAEYRYSGAGVGYQFASVVGGGFYAVHRGRPRQHGRRLVAPRRRLSRGGLPDLAGGRRADAGGAVTPDRMAGPMRGRPSRVARR